MIHSYVGIDSATFYHDGITTFKAPLGVAVETENFEDFNEQYVGIINELKKKYNLETNRVCVKGHFLGTKIGIDGSFWFVNDFVEKIITYLKMIYVCHVVISPTKLAEITFSNGSKMPTMKFVDLLTSSFNHLIAWNILEQFSEINQSIIFMDYFTGITTNAWRTMEGNPNLYALSAGEYCNSLISTADLICKYINDSLYRDREKLGFNGISKVFSNKNVNEVKPNMDTTEIKKVLDNKNTKLYQTSNSPFKMITPNSKRNIEIDRKLKHPVSFVLPSYKLLKEKGILESSPLFDSLTNDAYKNQGCVRTINLDDLTRETRYMKQGDKIITIGDEALESAKYLKQFGIPVEIIPSDDLIKE